MKKFENFVQHKTAGWVGVIYLDEADNRRVCNGMFDWPLTPEREEKVNVVQKTDADFTNFLRFLTRSCNDLVINMSSVRDMVCAELGIE